MIEIANDFCVPAPPGAVYDFLVDLERVGGCIPGGEVGPAEQDGTHPAQIAVKLGPMRFSYRGSVSLIETDEAGRRATLRATLREARGQGSAQAGMEMSVEPEDNGARVLTRTEVELTGRAAQMGRGVIDDVAKRVVSDMAACVTQRLAAVEPGDAPVAASPQEPVRGFSLIVRVLRERLARLLSRSRHRR